MKSLRMMNRTAITHDWNLLNTLHSKFVCVFAPLSMIVGFTFCQIAFSFWFMPNVSGQGVQIQMPSDEDTDRLMKCVFPTTIESFDRAKSNFVLEIREHPGFGPVRHLTITQNSKNEIRAVLRIQNNPEIDLSEQLINLLALKPKSTISEMCSHLKGDSKELELSRMTQSIVGEFTHSTAFAPSYGTFTLHPRNYEIWYVDSKTKLQFVVTSSDRKNPKESSIVIWARKLFASIDKS